MNIWNFEDKSLEIPTETLEYKFVVPERGHEQRKSIDLFSQKGLQTPGRP